MTCSATASLKTNIEAIKELYAIVSIVDLAILTCAEMPCWRYAHEV